MDGPLHTFSLTFAVITGTAAGTLAILSYSIFKQTPFGRSIFLLSMLMSGFILYHAFLLVFDTPPLIAEVTRSIVFTLLVLFILLMINVQRRVSRGERRG